MNPDNQNPQQPATNPEPPAGPVPPAGAAAPQFAAQFGGQAPVQPVTPEPDRPVKLASAFSLFRPSGQLVTRNFTNFAVLVLLPAFYLDSLDRFFNPKTAGHHTALWIVLVGVALVYNLIVFSAIPVLSLRVAQGHKFGTLEIIRLGWRYFWRILGLYIVITLAVVVGLLLLIVPGIIMMRRYYLASYFLIDQNVGIREAMRRSSAATKPHGGAIWGLIGVQILLGAPSWIPFIGPLLGAFTNVLYACAPALRYEELKALNSQVPPSAPAGS